MTIPSTSSVESGSVGGVSAISLIIAAIACSFMSSSF
jgi:hypothetical protein